MTSSAPLLIVDNDLDYLGALRMEPLAKAHPPIVATSESDAVTRLSTPGSDFGGVFIDPIMARSMAVPLVRLTLQRMPWVPVFFLTRESTLPITPAELYGVSVRGVMRKPQGFGDLMSAARAAPAKPKVPEAGAPQTPPQSIDQCVAIPGRQILTNGSSLFDLYVPLGSDRLLKILKAGDELDDARAEKYLTKGVERLYLARADQDAYLQACDQLAATLVSRTHVAGAIEVRSVLKQGEQTLNLLRASGVGEAGLAQAQQFVDRMLEIVRKLDVSKQPKLKALLDDALVFDHSIGTTMVVALLVQQMEFEAERALQSIGIASLLHDIGLQGLTPMLLDEEESALEPDLLYLYKQHPTIGAQMLSSIKGIDAGVVQAIEQHHERGDRSGFPQRSGATGINTVAALIGISDEYVRLLKRAARDPKIKPMEQMKYHVFSKFAPEVVEAFGKVFGGATS